MTAAAVTRRSRLIVHAGGPKVGSTAVQLWLGEQASVLRERGIVPVRLEGAGGPEPRWSAVSAGSAWSPASLMGPGIRRAEAAVRFGSQLRALLAQHATVVVSAEGLPDRLLLGDPALLGVLERLGRDVDAELVVFLRPQAGQAEAGWRQWGFRSGLPPSRWMLEWADLLDPRWLLRLDERLPGWRVRPVPTVEHGSAATDVVEVFAADVLGLSSDDAALQAGRMRYNVGLPLAVCAHLARRGDLGLWRGPHDSERFDALKWMLDDELRELDRSEPLVARTREHLAEWAASRFGAANAQVLATLGVDAPGWPRPDGHGASDAVDRRPSPPVVPRELREVDHLLGLVPRPRARRRLDVILEGLATRPRTGAYPSFGEP